MSWTHKEFRTSDFTLRYDGRFIVDFTFEGKEISLRVDLYLDDFFTILKNEGVTNYESFDVLFWDSQGLKIKKSTLEFEYQANHKTGKKRWLGREVPAGMPVEPFLEYLTACFVVE
ncbi:MAG TPA: hypothetical protein PLP27_05475 [Crocinitomicaceae bacterium]|nr:hypothetical protein [Crocinitomicaceae bacterium]